MADNTATRQHNRRRFERFSISESAIAIDPEGRRLGLVFEVGGGGMLVKLDSGVQRQELQPGKRLQVTVHEPATDEKNTMDVLVRYCLEDDLGLEFISGPA